MVKDASAASEIFATLDAEVPDMSGVKEEAVDISEDIVFNNVTFAYPTRPDTVVLDKLSLRFEAGKTTAIVGPSGSRKSTIVALLQRWHHPTAEKPSKPEGDDELSSVQESEKEKNDLGKPSSSERVRKFDNSGIFISGVNLSDIGRKELYINAIWKN